MGYIIDPRNIESILIYIHPAFQGTRGDVLVYRKEEELIGTFKVGKKEKFFYLYPREIYQNPLPWDRILFILPKKEEEK